MCESYRKQNKNNKINSKRTMRKIFYSAAVVLCAALAVSCASRNTATVTKGSKSKLDTLSYAMGINMSSGIGQQMGDIPFNFEAVKEAIEMSALEKGPKVVGEDTLTHERSLQLLREYFMMKRPQRAQAVAERRALADSIAVAEGREPEVVEPGYADPGMFESEEERSLLSYAFGTDIGNNLRNSQTPLQLVWLFQAIDDSHDGKAVMSDMEADNWLRTYFTVTIPAANKAASEKWLSKVERKSGVKKTESGLLYKVVKKGDADVMPTSDRDVVKVHYKGSKADGSVFDASRFADMPKERQEMMKQYRPDDYDADEPVSFALNRVIKGWGEGLKYVGKGGKITLWIPAELAYGEHAPGNIGANQALRFDVELIDVEPYEDPAAKAAAEVEAAEPAAEE